MGTPEDMRSAVGGNAIPQPLPAPEDDTTGE